MNRKGEVEGLGVFIMMTVAVIIGLVFLPAIASPVSKISQQQVVYNDSVSTAPSAVTAAGQINTTISYGISDTQYSDWRGKAGGCVLSSVTLTNSSGTEYTATTDYIFNATYGNFTLKNTATVNASVLSDNKTYVSYTHCDASYSTDTSARSGASLIPTIAIIALLVWLIGYVVKNWEEMKA